MLYQYNYNFCGIVSLTKLCFSNKATPLITYQCLQIWLRLSTLLEQNLLILSVYSNYKPINFNPAFQRVEFLTEWN